MKVGILTYHRADNYGAVLQVFALQKTILKMGYECEIIDYRCAGIENQYRYKKLRFGKGTVGIIKFNLNQYFHRKKHKNFELFRHKLSMSNPYTLDNIENANDEYDCFITGSDQVWNCDVNKNDYTYFLDFVKDQRKKNSYAASFGRSSIPQGLLDKYIELLSTFNNISVREEQACKIVESVLGHNCKIVLDPVLLLTKGEWEKYTDWKDGDYVVVYQLYKSKNLISFAKDLANRTKCKLVIISQSLYGAYYGVSNAVNKSNVGPEEFLSLLLGARYIVTNSYHGTAFAINFHKNFFTEFISGEYDVNSRFVSLLNLLNLQNRKIESGNHSNIKTNIDYEEVDKLLNKERVKSLEFLKKILSKENE
jgi:hypothetical protein